MSHFETDRSGRQHIPIDEATRGLASTVRPTVSTSWREMSPPRWRSRINSQNQPRAVTTTTLALAVAPGSSDRLNYDIEDGRGISNLARKSDGGPDGPRSGIPLLGSDGLP